MQINGKGGIDPNALNGIKPGAPERSAPPRRTDAIVSNGATERPKQDTVSFSDEARALATGSAIREQSSTERVSEVKQRVLLGAYNTAEMAGEVARRFLQRGDI